MNTNNPALLPQLDRLLELIGPLRLRNCPLTPTPRQEAFLRLLGPVPFRRGAVWVCGFELAPTMQYGSTGFAEPLRLFFRSLLAALFRPHRIQLPELDKAALYLLRDRCCLASLMRRGERPERCLLEAE